MTRPTHIAAALCLLVIGACTETTNQYRPLGPFEEKAFIQSGGLDTLFRYPFTFRQGTSIHFNSDEQNRLGFCLTVNNTETCHTTDREPRPIYMIEFVPHCQTETLALSIKSFGHPEPPFTIYYVNGEVTLERIEAEQLVASDPDCNFPRDEQSE